MSEPFKRLVAVLIASVAAMLSVVSLWQSNASEMDAQASRDFQQSRFCSVAILQPARLQR
jgi:hypothetical protein